MPKRTVSIERTGPRRRLPPEILTDAEVCALMRVCSRHAPTGLRNRALIALLYRAGLRINEALSLYPKDLELAGGSVRVLNGKGGRSRGGEGYFVVYRPVRRGSCRSGGIFYRRK